MPQQIQIEVGHAYCVKTIKPRDCHRGAVTRAAVVVQPSRGGQCSVSVGRIKRRTIRKLRVKLSQAEKEIFIHVWCRKKYLAEPDTGLKFRVGCESL